MQVIIFVLIFIAGFLTTPKILLFYDQIEYLAIVGGHSFWQVFSLGHFPIHPFFLPIFWITSRMTLPNYTAFIFGVISAVLIYKISKKIFKQKSFWLAAIIFLLFPGVWLINTNLMIQSVLLTFYLLAIFFFIEKKTFLFFITLFLMMGVHVDAVYWILSIFLLPFIFEKELKFRKKEILHFAKVALLSMALSALFYIFIYIFIRKDFGGSSEQIFAYASFGFLRIIRNIWVGFINSFGSITPFILLYLLIKKLRSWKEWLAWAIFAVLLSIGGAYWEGDLMMRRIVFAGVILSLALYKYLKKNSVFLILFLLSITGLNAMLYYKFLSDMPLVAMQQSIDRLPANEVLVATHYYYPFIEYEGKILWFESGETGNIDAYLQNGKRVFMTKESIASPYLLIVGNNYHITSLNKVGNSESKKIFEKYKVDLYGDVFELKSAKDFNTSPVKGEPVVFYGKDLSQRLSRMRINYGDLGIWVWSFITGHKDAVAWTYKDATGAWVWPEISIQ